MWRLLCPSFYVLSIVDLDMEALAHRGVKGIILDLDNTLIHWNSTTPSGEILDWFRRLAEKGFRACIVTNNVGPRVSRMAKAFSIPAVERAVKPRRRAFREAMAIMGTSTRDTMVVGDQVFTDILGANRLGLLSVLVVPLSQHEFIGTRLMRALEMLVLWFLERKGLIQRPLSEKHATRED